MGTGKKIVRNSSVNENKKVRMDGKKQRLRVKENGKIRVTEPNRF